MDPYHTLGVLRGCTRQQAKDAFRARAWHAHPDRGGDDLAFIQIHTAYKQILKELDRIGTDTAGRPVRTPVTRPPTSPTDPSWDREVIVMEASRPIPRPPTVPDPFWDPDLVLLDKPRRPPMPFDPRWDPDLVMLDEPARAPNTPDTNGAAGPFSSWLLEPSNRSDPAGDWWLSPRLRAVLTTILLILIIVNIVISSIDWLTPEK